MEIFCQNVSIWETKTINNNVDFLYFDPNGNLVLFGKDKSIIWAAGIGLDATKLIMQDDGNLVLYKDDDQSVWSTSTNNKCHSDKGLKLFCLFFFLFLIKPYCYTVLRRGRFKGVEGRDGEGGGVGGIPSFNMSNFIR